MFGFLNVNKPSGKTSHQVISMLRKITGIKQIGHAGTLDPLASGVLPVAIGKAAKLIDYLEENKNYQVGMYLGKISDTYDIEGKVENTHYRKISYEEIKNALLQFNGKICQIPPAYSAVHYKGKRLYELARNGDIPVDIPSRSVTIYKNNILNFDYDNQILQLTISCSKGTYIRSVVNDLGSILKSGAVMFELVRTNSSGFDIENSIVIDNNFSKETIEKFIINPISIIKLPKIEVTEAEYKKILNGNKFQNKSMNKNEVLLTKNNNVIALAFADADLIHPKKVLI